MTLIGHDAALQEFQEAIASGKLPHGIIIAGPEGIGKASFAFQVAEQLLAGDNEAAKRRIEARSHSDLLIIEREYDAKKDDFANDISVEQARGIAEFLSLTPGESDWRVVIIDSADHLNVNAANAILKILEEPPPQAVLLLVSHHPGRLLATIRSRCRLLRLSALTPKDYLKIMRTALPDYGDETYETLGELSEYSPGIAIELQKQGAATLYMQLEEIFDSLPNLPHDLVRAMAEQIATGSVHNNFRIFSRLVLHLIAERAKNSLPNRGRVRVGASTEDNKLLSKNVPLLTSPLQGEANFWATKWQEASEQFRITERLHLDTKSVIVSFFHSLNSPEPFLLSA